MLQKRADQQQVLVITNNYEQSCTDSEHDDEHSENHDDKHHDSKCGDHCDISETCEIELMVEEYEHKINEYAAEVS